MQLETSIPRLVRRSDLARSLGVDPRRTLLKALRPVAILLEAGREFELFDANIPAALVVNSQTKPE
jgi:hypothetical protein